VNRDRVFLVFDDESRMWREAFAETSNPLVHLHGQVFGLRPWLDPVIPENVPEWQPI
jgi:hypothetical protein